jgi:hypothetical protein
MAILPIPANARWKIEQNDSTGLWPLTRLDPTTQTWVLLAERYTTQADAVAAVRFRQPLWFEKEAKEG